MPALVRGLGGRDRTSGGPLGALVAHRFKLAVADIGIIDCWDREGSVRSETGLHRRFKKLRRVPTEWFDIAEDDFSGLPGYTPTPKRHWSEELVSCCRDYVADQFEERRLRTVPDVLSWLRKWLETAPWR
jgi:hypothetical protein